MKEVNYKVTVDTKGAQKGVKDLNKEIDNTSKKSKQAEGSLDGVTNVADRATGGMISATLPSSRGVLRINQTGNTHNKTPQEKTMRVCKDVLRGFSLVLHAPEGSHYKIWR